MGSWKSPETRRELLEAGKILQNHNRTMRYMHKGPFGDDSLYDSLTQVGLDMLKSIRCGWCRAHDKYVEYAQCFPNGKIYIGNSDPKQSYYSGCNNYGI